MAVGAAVAYAVSRCRSRRREESAAREEARQAEHLAYAGRLVSGLIHEIKNPLNALSLNLQLLAEDWRDAETQQERRALKRIAVSYTHLTLPTN